MRDIGWDLWIKHNETSGTTVTNYGSIVTSGTWTPGSGSLGQTGFLGTNEAYDYDGANSRISIPNNSIFGNAGEFTQLFLFKADGNGEGGIGHLFRFGVANTNAHVNDSQRITTRRRAATTTAVSEVSGAWSVGNWSIIFVTFSNSGDRKLHVYRGQNNSLNELTYISQIAAVGTLTNETDTLFIGNASNLTTTFDGLIDEFAFKNRVLSNQEMLNITKALHIA